MPLLRYFTVAGGALLALLFVASGFFPETGRQSARLVERFAIVCSDRKANPAGAVALPSALHASTVGKAFSEVATNSVRARAHASVRPGLAIFLYSGARSWPALSTTVPLCCNHCRAWHGLPTILKLISTLYVRVMIVMGQNYFFRGRFA